MITKPCLLQLLKAALLDEIISPSELRNLCALVVEGGTPWSWMDQPLKSEVTAEYGEEQLVPGGCYHGTIKSFNLNKGYGFIACPELLVKHGCDVFMHRNQFFACPCDLSVGDSVVFRVEISKQGKPQARELYKYSN